MRLTTDQIRIIKSKPNGHMLIRGVAGSGKTTVAVQKIPHIINHFLNEKDEKILLITYNKTLIKYIEHTIRTNDLQDSIYMEEDLNGALVIKTIDSIIYSLYEKLQRRKGTHKELIKSNEKRESISNAIKYVSKKNVESTIVNEKNIDFLMEEIDWILSCNITNREEYLNMERTGRMSQKEEKNRFLLQKNSVNRNAIYDFLECYYDDLNGKGYTDFKMKALDVLNAIKNHQIDFIKYPHVIVDESQDLTRVQLEIISHFYDFNRKDASITFIADTAQSIYPHSWFANHSFKSIGFDMSGRTRILSRNYRTTMEIAKAAYSMIEKDENVTKNENYVQPQIVEKHGQRPIWKHFQNDVEELVYVEKLIKDTLCLNYDLKDITILARNNTQLMLIQDYLNNHGISAKIIENNSKGFDKDLIQLLTLHKIKGLEYQVVIIMGINEGILPYENKDMNINNQNESFERKLLYVGMTRAKSELYLTSAKRASMFLSDINPKYLGDGKAGFTMFYRIGYENYRFKEKIKDLYSKEEMVRQWYIEQLISNLGYSIELLDIEYKVQAFSKIGFVDVVIFDIVKSQKEPLAFVEIKQKGENLESAMEQLKQYIDCCKSVRFGVVTNGVEMICMEKTNKGFETISQLPHFQKNLSNLYVSFIYHNLKDDESYDYKVNAEDHDEIIIKKRERDETIDIKRFAPVAVYGKVAAGHMQTVYEEFIGNIRVPEDFLYDIKNCFGLQVDGNSMIGADIEKGDYVFVQNQSFPKRGDIVIAVNREMNEATMKRFDRVGDMIILSPENDDYETMIIPVNDLYINGVVIGVLKCGNVSQR